MIISDNHSIVVAGDEGTFDERNITLVKTDSAGNLLWSKRYQLSVNFTNYPYDVIEAPDDDGYAIISDVRPPAYYRDAGIIRTDYEGNLMCYNAPYLLTVRSDSLLHHLPTITQVPATVIVNTITPQSLPYLITEKIRCESPKANFTFSGDTLCPQYCLTIKNTSEHATLFDWQFPGGHPSVYTGSQPPLICYDSAGVYTIHLSAGNGLLTDTLTRTISIEPFCNPIFIPNIITPNGDGKNEYFVIQNLPDNFHLQIFNRWGNRVFETRSHSVLWQGEEAGVYFYTLSITYPSNSKEYHGTVTVVRE